MNRAFIKMANIEFTCPYCLKQYDDADEKYLNRLNRNKSGYTQKTCECGKTFGIAFEIIGKVIGFKLQEEKWTEKLICPNGGDGCDIPEPCELCKYYVTFCSGCEAKKHKEKEDE